MHLRGSAVVLSVPHNAAAAPSVTKWDFTAQSRFIQIGDRSGRSFLQAHNSRLNAFHSLQQVKPVQAQVLVIVSQFAVYTEKQAAVCCVVEIQLNSVFPTDYVIQAGSFLWFS